MKKRVTIEGYTIVEVIVAIAIIVGSLVGFFIFAAVSSDVGSLTIERQEATAVAREGIEVVRLLRDEDWGANIATIPFDTAYHPSISGGVWFLSAVDPGLIHGLYSREIRIFEVFRDGADDIVAVGVSDNDTRLVRSTVTWERKGKPKQLILDAYITNWRSYITP